MYTPSPEILKELENVPALPPPPGVTPNFINPTVTHYTEWVVTAAMCLTFTSLFVLMRIYTKFILVKTHGWEDYTCVIAWLGFIGYVAYDAVTFSAGAGVHQWDIPVTKIGRTSRVANAKEIFNGPVIFFTKLSILLQFKRIFAPHRIGRVYYFIQALIWSNLGYYIACTLALIFLCTPRRKLWDVFNPEGHCVNVPALFITSAVINLVSDILMLLIPVFSISALQIPLGKKIGVTSVFVTGISACVASAMRTATSIRVVGKKDLTYEFIPISFWADAEIACGIIVGCMPVMAKFTRLSVPLIKSRFSSYLRTKNSATKSSVSASTKVLSAARTPWSDPYDVSRPLDDADLELSTYSLALGSNVTVGPSSEPSRSRFYPPQDSAENLESGAIG